MKAHIKIFNINFRRLCSIALVAITWPVDSSGQVIALDSVIASIDRNNPTLKQYDSRVLAYEEYAEGASAWMAPMVGAGPFMRPYRPAEATHERDEGAWMFSVEQDIPNPAKLRATRDYIRSQGVVEGQSRAIALNNLRSEARLLYYEWLVAEEKMDRLQKNAELMDFLVRLVRIRYPYSQESLGNIYQAEARLAQTENMLLTTQGEIDQKRYRLKVLMNLPQSDSIAVDTTTKVRFEPIRIAYDTAGLRDKRSDARQIGQLIETMKLNQQVESFRSKPDFRVRIDHMQAIGNMPNQFSAMAMVTIPIAPWSSKTYRSGIRGVQYEIESLEREREAILAEARGRLSGIASRITRTQRQLENYRTKILPALHKGYQSLIIAYEENREQLPAAIDGWEAINIAETEYLDKLEEYYTLIANYEKEIEK